ncbi:MAG: S-layer homology domain-containing protein [Clostridia bacterium]|nr:S-layer homology domain-containing protein [Clostridia bacterium]
MNAVQSEDDPYDGEFCAFLKSPLEYSADNGVFRQSAYMYSVPLEQGKLYEFKMSVKSTVSSLSAPFLRTDYDYDYNRITFDVIGIGEQWQEVRQMFIAGSDGLFELCLNIFDSEYSYGVYIDSVELTEKASVPVSIQIEGARNVFVPEFGEINYEYNAAAIDEYGNILPVITAKIITSPLPDGMYFSEETNTLTVTSNASAGDTFKIYAASPYGPSDLPIYAINITADNNYIENGHFTDLPELNGFETEDGTLSVYHSDDGKITAKIATTEQDENVFTATLSIDKTYLLNPSVTYVLRARIFTEEDYHSRFTQSSESIVSPDGTVYVNILNADSNESEVMTAFEVEASGIYQIKIKFINPDDRPVYISSVGLYKEELAPSEILFDIPAHITIPESDTLSVPVGFVVRDQAGNLLPDYEFDACIEPEGNGVAVSENKIIVSEGAAEGQYKLYSHAVGTDLSASQTVEITNESVGDGSFEVQASGQCFKTASPSELSIVKNYHGYYPSDGHRFARLTFNGDVSAVLADSVFKFDAGAAYVFDAYIKKIVPDIDTVVTLIVYNTDSSSFDESMPVLQFTLSDSPEINRVFIPNESMTGRIMIAFNTPAEHYSQIVLMDNLKIKKAEVWASDVTVSGYPYPYKVLTGKHHFSANFETAELSVCRWLSSPTIDGVYIPIDGETEPVLSITESMVGSFLKYEITPSSLSGPVYGESVTSSPVQIMPLSNSEELVEISPEPSSPHNTVTIGTDEPYMPDTSVAVTQDGLLDVVNIYSPTFKQSAGFYDTINHWADEDIKIMSSAGIVNGRGDMLFAPDDLITRAEFSALLIRSFSLAPLYYTGAFSDVKISDWYSGVVETVTKYNIANGTGDGIFAPDAPLTREQLAAMIMRAINLTGVRFAAPSPLKFTDSGNISIWAKSDVETAVSMGLITGFPDNTFAPQKNCTRAEATALIKRMISYVISN